MSNYREGSGVGARDRDPIAIMLLIFLIIVLFNWLSSPTFSPLPSYNAQGCSAWASSCTTNAQGVKVGTYDTTHYFAYLFNSVALLGIFKLMVPLMIVMFIYYCYSLVFGSDMEKDFRVKINRENIDAVRNATMDARLALAKARMKTGKAMVTKGRILSKQEIEEELRRKKEGEDQKVKKDYEGQKNTK